MIEEDKLKLRMQRIAELVRRIETEGDAAAARTQSKELLESVMDLHGEALDRILQGLRGAGLAGERLVEAMATDPVVGSVLLLYGLHPLDFDTRVRRAMEKAQPTLRSYGIDAELIGVKGGAIRIRFGGVDSAFTARAIRSAMEDEIYAAAPDAASVTFVGLEQFAAPDFIPLEKVGVLTAAKGAV